MKFVADTHSHTLASGHAYSTIKEMAVRGKSKRIAGTRAYGARS